MVAATNKQNQLLQIFLTRLLLFEREKKNVPRASSSKQTRRSHILKLYSKVVTKKILILIKNGICRTISEM